MLKKTIFALFGLVFAMALIIPPKANAQVVVGVSVVPFVPRPAYGRRTWRTHHATFTRLTLLRVVFLLVGGSTRDPMLTDMQGRVATGGGGTICGSKS